MKALFGRTALISYLVLTLSFAQAQEFFGDWWGLEKSDKLGGMVTLSFQGPAQIDSDHFKTYDFTFSCSRSEHGKIGVVFIPPDDGTYNNQENKVAVLLHPIEESTNSIKQSWVNGYRYMAQNNETETRGDYRIAEVQPSTTEGCCYRFFGRFLWSYIAISSLVSNDCDGEF